MSQNNHPIAFFSKTISKAQAKYTTTEQGLLAIVKTFKEYKPILMGHEIIIYTDHKI